MKKLEQLGECPNSDPLHLQPPAAVALSGAAGKWVTVTVTSAAQARVSNPAASYGLALLHQAASGSVYISVCFELGLESVYGPPAPQAHPHLYRTDRPGGLRGGGQG